MIPAGGFFGIGAWEVVTMLLAFGGGSALVVAVVCLIVKVIDR